jgi:hypothetical protein
LRLCEKNQFHHTKKEILPHLSYLYFSPDIPLLSPSPLPFSSPPRSAESEKTDIFCQVLMDFHPTSSKHNDQNHLNREPRALNPIAIAYLKALISIFWLLK